MRISAKTVAKRASAGRTSTAKSAAVRVQAKLRVSQAADPQEQEADRMAEAVAGAGDVTATAGDESRSGAASRGGMMGRGIISRKSNLAASGPSSASTEISGTAANRVQNLRGGSALPQKERSFFESRMGGDFGNVRIHQGADAGEAANSINARAFTRGNDIAFAPGEYRPESIEGRRLLAHELTHVMQQSGFLTAGSGSLTARSGGRDAGLVQREPKKKKPGPGPRDITPAERFIAEKIDLILAGNFAKATQTASVILNNLASVTFAKNNVAILWQIHNIIKPGSNVTRVDAWRALFASNLAPLLGKGDPARVTVFKLGKELHNYWSPAKFGLRPFGWMYYSAILDGVSKLGQLAGIADILLSSLNIMRQTRTVDDSVRMSAASMALAASHTWHAGNVLLRRKAGDIKLTQSQTVAILKLAFAKVPKANSLEVAMIKSIGEVIGHQHAGAFGRPAVQFAASNVLTAQNQLKIGRARFKSGEAATASIANSLVGIAGNGALLKPKSHAQLAAGLLLTALSQSLVTVKDKTIIAHIAHLFTELIGAFNKNVLAGGDPLGTFINDSINNKMSSIAILKD